MPSETFPITTGARARDTRSESPARPAVLHRARRRVGADKIAVKALNLPCRCLYRVVLDDLLAAAGGGLAVLRTIRNRDPGARVLVVTADGSIVPEARQMRALTSDFVAELSGQHRPLAPLDATAQPHGAGSALAPASPPIEDQMPESGWRGDLARARSGLVPGFAAPEQDPVAGAPASPDRTGADGALDAAIDALVGMPLAEVERLMIEATIHACGGSLPKAARVLGVSPSTLYRKRAGWTDRPDGQ